MDLETIAFYLIIISAIISPVLFYLYLKKYQAHKELHLKYSDVVDIDNAISNRKITLNNIETELIKLQREFESKTDELGNDYTKKRLIYESLLRDISLLEEDLEDMSFGLYKPHFDFDTSESYKNEITGNRQRQKSLIKAKTAIICHSEWEVGGSKQKGRKMTNKYSKLMLRAFNSECDAAVLKVSWNNIQKMEERIMKAFDVINTLGETHHIDITNEYLRAKIDELRLTHEYKEKKYEEKEEQKRIREQMREEEKARREIEKAQKEAEVEEIRYQTALDKARGEVSATEGNKLDKLNLKIAELENRLVEAKDNKERALSRAQMTKSGHVYIISNIGSFGDDIYKIGMTRRLDPIDRVKELGDASVPFAFDVHAMIYSENAPELENNLHKAFTAKRVNLVNTRKEFFNISIEMLEKFVKENNGNIELTRLAEAKEYRETISIIEQNKVKNAIDDKIADKFPEAL